MVAGESKDRIKDGTRCFQVLSQKTPKIPSLAGSSLGAIAEPGCTPKNWGRLGSKVRSKTDSRILHSTSSKASV
jgi:hypothetical protein